MTKVTDYDFFGYDYENYWEARRYENEAEKMVLDKIFKKKSGNWFLDIGGSYGRLASTYQHQYSNPIVLDYSLKTLLKNSDALKSKYPNIKLIAANAYKLPFKENAFDGALMVRVLHHIEKPDVYLKELERVMKNNSYYIQEFANKVHLMSSLRAILHFNFGFFTKEPYQQPTKGNFEGTKSGEEAIFYNYHPTHIKEALEENNFKILQKYGCSYIRSSALKKILGENLMINIEKILQSLLFWTNIPPSIIYETVIKKKTTNELARSNDLEEILACPKCKGSLLFSNDMSTCEKCSSTFVKRENIWDFRIK